MMNQESNRLNTFTNWPSSAPVDPGRIAKAGFFYTGNGTEVQCFSCGCKISDWNYGDQAMWRHRQMDPSCSFVSNPLSSGNVPLVIGRESNNQNLEPRDTDSGDYGLIEDDEMYKSDALRLLSFVNWQDPSVSREEMVSAGFYHGGGGKIRCAWCGGEIAPMRNLGIIGTPLEIHRLYFPRCRYAMNLEEERRAEISPPGSPSYTPPIQSPPIAINYQPQSSGAEHNARVIEAGEQWNTLGVVGGGPKHPAKASLEARLGTFHLWPGNRVQAPKTLADAGFFYTGIDDQVRCFYCDGGLGKWETGDVPWTEHAHWFPHCGYVLLVKGPEFVNACRNRASVPRTFSADRGLNTRTRNHSVNFPVTPSQIDECMESGPAIAALGAGLDAARVRRAIVRRLRATGVTFTTSEALIDAVLDEQLNEESWSVSPRSRLLARDILADSMRDFTPGVGLVPLSAIVQQTEFAAHILARATSPVQPTLINTPTTSNPQQNTEETSIKPTNNSEKESSPEKKQLTPEKKQLTLEEENRQLKEARMCKVCMDNEVNVVFLPCGHLVSCAGCGAALRACPLCRAAVRALVRAYLA